MGLHQIASESIRFTVNGKKTIIRYYQCPEGNRVCQFNKLDETSKQMIHEKLTESQAIVGGTNFFLTLLEDIRQSKPSPLLSKRCEYKTQHAILTWNKAIFKENLQLLGTAIQTRTIDKDGKHQAILPDDTSDKNYKNLLNMLRSLKPLVFSLRSSDPKEDKILTFSPFEIQGETTRINLLFAAVFFCHPDFAKEALKYKARES